MNAQSAPQAISPTQRDAAKTVLVVATSATQRTILGHFLREKGRAVLEAGCRQEAEEKLDATDAVIMSWELGDIQGPELIRAWQTHDVFRWIPVLMLTSHDEPKRIEYALSCGAVDFVRKPPNAIELHARLEAALRIKELQDELRRLASRDALTGLYNRRIFIERLENEFARYSRYEGVFSLAILDVDHFKSVNDTHGHDIGDLILKQFAAAAVEIMRQTDCVARYGGEEFGVIMPETSTAQACRAIERLRRSGEDRRWGNEKAPLAITFSAGVSSNISKDVVNPDSMIKIADLALYRAKEGGRNRVVSAEAQKNA